CGTASTATFEAVEASWGLEQPTRATKLEMLITEPDPCSSICGMAYLQPRNTPRTLTAMTRSQPSTEGAMTQGSASGMIAASLWRTSPRPKAATVSSTIRF